MLNRPALDHVSKDPFGEFFRELITDLQQEYMYFDRYVVEEPSETSGLLGVSPPCIRELVI